MITVINQALLAEVSAEAKQAPRRRRTASSTRPTTTPAPPAQRHRARFYVMPHRHLDPAKDEGIVCLRGRLGIVVFGPSGVDRNIP